MRVGVPARVAATALAAAFLPGTACRLFASTMAKTVASYGTWASPLTAETVAAGSLRLGEIQLDGETVYWLEGRASEAGRNVVVRRAPDGTTVDVTPVGFDVRSRVHEYGGAAYLVHEGTVYFSNFDDQRLYVQRPGAVPVPLTAAGHFFADCRMDARRRRLVCVREDHTGSGEPVAAIVAVGVAGAKGESGVAGQVLVSGADFYSDPIVSSDGGTLAWLQWNHPNMPWDGTELWTAAIQADGSLGTKRKVAGAGDESIFQPEWAPDGDLYFVSDRTGWWNLYRRRGPALEPMHPMPAEFGKPQWTFGTVTYAFAGDRLVAATYAEGGRWHLALIETATRAWRPIPLAVQPLDSIRADDRAVYFVGGSATQADAITRVALAGLEPEALRRSTGEAIAPEWVSVPESVTFEVSAAHAHGASRGGEAPARRDVHAFYYPPTNPRFRAPPGEKPPLVVTTHGGPTGATSDVLSPEVQFWTSRGFAVLDVNYSGSTGYGRAYRDRLRGEWGVVEVADAVGGARAMVAEGRADPARLVIRGGSAGGYTTLAALTFHSTFKAGASYYGISDVEVLARDTHKFESRYLDSLIGPYPAAKDRYAGRSPIHFTDRLACPLILFQGLEDEVVPPDQSATMAEAVRRKGLPVAYVTFGGEQHGFRKAESITRALEAELYFYGQVFGFEIADEVAPVEIENLRR